MELEGRHVGPKGQDINGLLKDYQIFWSGNSDKMSNRFAYQGCDAQLSLFGYMRKAFNWTMRLVKEFASGTGFVDVCACYGRQRYPMELRMKSKGLFQAGRHETASGVHGQVAGQGGLAGGF
ncbi:MAG: hypothetical protein LBP92_08455 [Deltaproteobacteria bacterium]|nr:hypothetical protein [Deltaproteobacteria bacterium]